MRTAGLLLRLLPACGCWRVVPTSSGCRQARFSAIDIRPFNDGGRVQHSICTLEPLRMLAAPRRAALLRLSLAGQAADEDEDGEDDEEGGGGAPYAAAPPPPYLSPYTSL